jgi:hypothetical protein
MEVLNMENLICQSCGMPMNDVSLLATEKDSSTNKEYCIYCYKDGEFTSPDSNLEGMIEECVPHMVKGGMPESKAREILNAQLPKLKRWKV